MSCAEPVGEAGVAEVHAKQADNLFVHFADHPQQHRIIGTFGVAYIFAHHLAELLLPGAGRKGGSQVHKVSDPAVGVPFSCSELPGQSRNRPPAASSGDGIPYEPLLNFLL